MLKISRKLRPHTITLYNYMSTAAGVMVFQRTVIKHVFLDTGYAQKLSKQGVSTSDTAHLIVDTRDIETTSDRIYISYPDWLQLTDIEKALYFTFCTNKDFFIQGEVTDTLPTVTKQQMQTKYQCFSATGVNCPTSDILDVTGK